MSKVTDIRSNDHKSKTRAPKGFQAAASSWLSGQIQKYTEGKEMNADRLSEVADEFAAFSTQTKKLAKKVKEAGLHAPVTPLKSDNPLDVDLDNLPIRKLS